MRKFLCILFYLLCSNLTWGQADSIPFLRASLMVGEPSFVYPQTVFGHAFLRLQCPSAGLDNCFSMESGDYEGFLDICIGNYPNRLVVIPTKEYLNIFNTEGRIVTEYFLNLTQKEIQSLWKFLDEKNLSGNSPYHDFFHHGCSQEMIHFLAENLNGTIVYGERAKGYGNTLYTLGTQTLSQNSWVRLPFVMLLSTDGTDTQISDAEKTAVPYIIPDLFSDAHIIGEDGFERPILVQDISPVVYQPSVHFTGGGHFPIYVWFVVILVVIGVLSLIGLWSKGVDRMLDMVSFTGYSLIVLFLLFVCIVSTLPTTSGWNWNYIIYNPIPLLIWFYGRFHQLPWSRIYLCYTIWIGLFLIGIYIIGGHYVLEQYFLALIFMVRCLFKCVKRKY